MGGGPGGGPRGFGGPGGPPQPGQILPPMLRQRLAITPQQEKEIDALQKEVDAKLEKLLNAEQRQQLKEMRERGPGGFGPPPGRGGPAALAHHQVAVVLVGLVRLLVTTVRPHDSRGYDLLSTR